MLRVVTFNYDRSLEHFLTRALRSKYGVSDSRAANLVSLIPIVHVHGILDSLADRAYGRRIDNALMAARAAKGIRIIHEGKADTRDFIEARKWITSSQRLYCVGFGYAEQNVKRLGLHELAPGMIVHGSAYRLTAAEKDRASGLFQGRITLHSSEFDAYAFLRNAPALDA